MRRALVAGFGVTGRAAARALLAAGHDTVVCDDARDPAAADAAVELGVELVVAPTAERLAALVRHADLVVASPGIPVGHPVFGLAARWGTEVVSEVELAARRLAAAPAASRPRVAAITGTNGKTTVTTAATAALERSGVVAVAAGNIGVPMVEAVAAPGVEAVVAELSSFQLQLTSTLHPDVSCWLNLAPDHLDWHPSHEHYRDAKARIWANQGPGDTVVVNADDAEVLAAAARRPPGSRLVTFSLHAGADWHERGGTLVGPDGDLMASADLARSLPHDRANALAAAATASALGAGPDAVVAALRATGPLPHRVELVAAAAGVSWYDDSKATTPASVLAAVAGFTSAVLVAGGRNKGLDLGPLAGTVPPVHAVVAIGESAGEVGAAFAGSVPVRVAGSMAEAVAAAADVSLPGDAVLLSPGCASFDWYRNYAERGDDFAACVKRRLQKESTPC